MMNTKLIMTLSALILGTIGILTTFVPDLIVEYLNIEANQMAIFLVQILGALYVGFAMLNWMTKTSLIGGIYNRPIAMANFTHFLIAGLALVKGLTSNPDLPLILWVVGAVYAVFGLSFGVILFRHPIAEKKSV